MPPNCRGKSELHVLAKSGDGRRGEEGGEGREPCDGDHVTPGIYARAETATAAGNSSDNNNSIPVG